MTMTNEHLPHGPRGASRGGDLQNIREDVKVGIPRGDGHEETRVVAVTAETPDGKRISWTSVGVFWRADDGTWRRGKNVATIRSKELAAVADALMKLARRPDSAASPQRPPGARAPEHRESSGRQPERPLQPPTVDDGFDEKEIF